MYIRSTTGWGQDRLPLNYISLGFSDEPEAKTQLSSGVISHLTSLVFFARHPPLKGKAIKGNRVLEAEWSRIKSQLLKPSSAGNSTGWVIDLALPKSDPKPDYSRTEAELGVWEAAIISSKLPFRFATEKTVMPDRKPGSYLSLLSLKFDAPRLSVFIAKHLRENAFDQSKSREGRYAWQQTLLLVQKHAYVHLKLFRRAAEDLQKVLQGLFNRLLPLPTGKKPLAVPQAQFEAYLQSLGEFLNAVVKLEFWEKTCDWEKKDYPELSQRINKAGAVFMPHGLKVNCGSRPDVPDLPVPPVPIRPK